MNLEELDALRDRCLENIYQQVGGATLRPASIERTARDLQLNLDLASQIRSFLQAEGLIQGIAYRTVSLTHRGIKRIEQRMREANLSALNDLRLRFLAAAVEEAEKGNNGLFEAAPIGAALGLSVSDAKRVVGYCVDKGFIRPGSDEGGIYYVERKAKDAVERGTVDVWQPPVLNQLNIGGNATGIFQQGGHAAVQVATIGRDQAQQLIPLVEKLREEVKPINLPDTLKSDLESLLNVFASKLKSEEPPKKSFLQELLTSTRSILEGGAGGLLSTAAILLLSQISALLA